MTPALRLVVVAALALVACSSDDDSDPPGTSGGPGGTVVGGTSAFVPLDGEKICASAASCGSDAGAQDIAECAKGYDLLVASPDCKSKLEGITCTSSVSTILAECFPPCDATFVPKCDGSHLSQCVSGKTSVYDCKDVCAYAGQTYSGLCGTSIGGQASDPQKCFCQ